MLLISKSSIRMPIYGFDQVCLELQKLATCCDVYSVSCFLSMDTWKTKDVKQIF